MYRTDKQFMKNPATATMRIYIGGLPKTTIADDLEKVFKKYGTITGMSLNSGFAFIQFEHEHEAQQAIQNENGAMLNGRKITVKQAVDKSRNNTNNNNSNNSGNQQQQQRMLPQKQFQNLNQQILKTPPQEQQQQQQPPPPLQHSPIKPLQQTPPRQAKIQEPPRKLDPEPAEECIEDDRPNIRPPNQFNDRGKKVNNRGGARGRSNDRFERFEQREGGRDLRFEPPPLEPYRGRDNYYDNFPQRVDNFAPPPIIDAQPPPAAEKNDCEIIVVSKALTDYAEFIEAKLKNLGLVIDLLFPNEDVPIGKVLANISSRGCLYAILVMPTNEEHRSLTLNILHGSPQEHRNMPVEDALILISHNFEAYMKGQHLPAENPKELKLTDRHPVSMQMLLNLLAENRQLTSTQYDQLIKYLQDRRELQHEFEVAEGIVPQVEELDSKQAELQNRILNILNKSNEQSMPSSIIDSTPGDAPILKDPTVQKALDSLMLGDMLKNIAGV